MELCAMRSPCAYTGLWGVALGLGFLKTTGSPRYAKLPNRAKSAMTSSFLLAHI